MTTNALRKLYTVCKTPLHVQKHMRQVANVAESMAKKIKRNGHDVDVAFTKNLALIHDLMKALSFKENKKINIHDVVITSEILAEHKEKDLARAVLSQQFDAVISTIHPLKSIEEMIVYYADKRVAHTDIVSLDERFEEGSRRYGKRNKRIEKEIRALETELSCMAGENLAAVRF